MNRKNRRTVKRSSAPDRDNAMSYDANRLTHSVVRVGDGRGFVVRCQSYQGLEDLIIITAAHCLPHLPPPHPAMYLEERTYQRLLGPLGSEPMVWAECLFADPVADIAVLGSPDNQALYKEAESYEQLLASAHPLTIVDAPAQGSERLTFGDLQTEHPTPGEGIARVLSLEGRWLEGRVTRRSNWVAFEPKDLIVGGMSGSPIISESGEAIGVVSVSNQSPVIVDSLSAELVRKIIACQAEDHAHEELADLPFPEITARGPQHDR
jgi:hypothetical protein